MSLVRNATNLNTPKIRIAGGARVNGAATNHPAAGTIGTKSFSIIGNAHVVVATGSVTGSGSVATRRLRITNGAALAIRRAIGSGIACRTKNIVVAGTGTAIDADAAVVQLFNVLGNPSGFGPSSDPEGVFFGRTDLVSGDVWWPSAVPSGCSVAPLPGGSFTLTVGSGVAVGSYSFTVNLRVALTRTTVQTSKAFSVT